MDIKNSNTSIRGVDEILDLLHVRAILCSKKGMNQMSDFLKFYNQVKKGSWSLEIYHSSIMDWCINIGYKTTSDKHGEKIIYIQDCDMELAFAKAQVDLKEWLLENEGGY